MATAHGVGKSWTRLSDFTYLESKRERAYTTKYQAKTLKKLRQDLKRQFPKEDTQRWLTGTQKYAQRC